MADVITQSQVVPRLDVYGEFETITGGNPNINTTDYFEPGSKSPRKIAGTGNYSDVVLTRAFVFGRDNQLIDRWKAKLSGQNPLPLTLIKQFRNALGIIEGTQTFRCHLKDVDTPDGKAGDNTIAEIKVTLSVEALL